MSNLYCKYYMFDIFPEIIINIVKNLEDINFDLKDNIF